MPQLLFASCAKLLEGLLREELISLGAEHVKETVAGVYFQGDMALAYRVCLWSRLANHVLLQLSQFEADDDHQLYQAVSRIDWSEHLEANSSFCIQVSGQHANIRHPHFIAQRTKDAIVDQFRQRCGNRPSVVTTQPNVCLNLYVDRTHCTLSVDLSGESLHRRGYRLEAGKAPLKETLAAAILIRAGWPQRLQQPSPVLFDPMCGTGTLLAEAALMAFDIAPGLYRHYFGFLGWQQHRPAIWKQLKHDAEERREKGLARNDVFIVGADIHPQAIQKSRENIQRTQLTKRIHLERADCTESPPSFLLNHAKGLIICNPPYGERMKLEEEKTLSTLFTTWGMQLHQQFQGWELALFSGASRESLKGLRFRTKRHYALFNGTIPCHWYLFDLLDTPQDLLRRDETLLPSPPVGAERALPRSAAQDLLRDTGRARSAPTTRQVYEHKIKTLLEEGLSEGAQMFANRLQKNIKHLRAWVKRDTITCYRLYDADLPEYAAAIDGYEGKWLHVQEYQAPKEIEAHLIKQRLVEMLAVLHSELNIPHHQIFLKVRQPQKGSTQYEKIEETKKFYTVTEGPAKFRVNFTDYLDTGLFLDHRLVRRHMAEASQGKTFLNLFAYTSTASVQAALAGATHTTSIDLSHTYLEWSEENFRLNRLSLDAHTLVQADCLQWLNKNNRLFDVIFLNPPTFSNSKRMATTWDVQRDHVALLHQAMKHLKSDGILYFSCNLKNFKINKEALKDYQLTDISRATLPKDFIRAANRHHVWTLCRRNSSR